VRVVLLPVRVRNLLHVDDLGVFVRSNFPCSIVLSSLRMNCHTGYGV
jgi:hypothetical protein